MAEKILRAKEVTKIAGLSRSTIWRMENVGTFPARRKLSLGAVGWIESEVLKWIEAREKVAN